MANTRTNILVPVGFSEQSIMALDQAVIFAKAMKNARIFLLSVIEEERFLKRIFNARSKEAGFNLEQAVRDKAKELANEYNEKTGIEIETMVAQGIVYEEIARVSEYVDAELVVMGTNGKPQNLRRRFIGSNAYRVATLVKPPVITIKGVRSINKIETIIFPLMLDRRSKEKVGPVLKYARLFDAKIKIVAVKTEDDEEKILNANVRQVENFIKNHGIECSSAIIQPQEHKGIVRNVLNYAYENDGDLITIIEEPRQRDITDYFLGSDVQAVIYHSEIPVMSITPSQVKYEAMWENF